MNLYICMPMYSPKLKTGTNYVEEDSIHNRKNYRHIIVNIIIEWNVGFSWSLNVRVSCILV